MKIFQLLSITANFTFSYFGQTFNSAYCSPLDIIQRLSFIDGISKLQDDFTMALDNHLDKNRWLKGGLYAHSSESKTFKIVYDIDI